MKKILFSILFSASLLLGAAQEQTRLIINPQGHTSIIPEAAASHDGKFLVSVSHDKSVKIWSTEYGNIVAEFFGERGDASQGQLFCLAISPDDRWLAVAGYLIEQRETTVTSFIRIYNLEKKKLHTVLRGHSNVINSLDFSPDGQLLASAGSDGHVMVWNAQNYTALHDITAHNGTAKTVRFTSGHTLASGGWDEKLNIIDADKGKIIASRENSGKISGMCWSAENNFLFTYADGSVKAVAWDLSLEKQTEVDVFQPIGSIACRGKYLIAGQERYPYTTSIFYFQNGTYVPSTLFNELDNTVTSCGFIDGKTAWSAGGSGNEIVLYTYQAPDKNGNITLSPGNMRLKGYGHSVCAVGYTQNLIGFADVKCDRLFGKATLTSFFDLNNNTVYHLDPKYDPLFKHLVTEENEYKLKHSKGGILDYPNAVLTLYKNDQPQWNYTLDDYTGYRHNVYAFAGRQWVLSGSDDIAVLNYQGQQRARLKGHEGEVLGLWTDSLGKYIFSSGRDQTIRLWDISKVEDKNTFMRYDQLYETSKSFFRKKYPGFDFSTGEGMAQLYEKVKKDFGDDTAHYLLTPKEIKPLVNFFIGLNNEWVMWTDEGYFKSSREGAKFVAYLMNRGQEKDAGYYPFEQFDLKYNRPDIINQLLGVGDSSFNASLKKAHERRLQKAGLKEEDLSTDKHLPEAEILSAPTNTDQEHYLLEVSCSDDRYSLYKLHVYNNDVPVFGSGGIPVTGKDLHRFKQVLQVPLVNGHNKITVTVVNEKGAESLQQEISVFCTRNNTQGDLYVVAIGASKYSQEQFNLTYAAKDAKDVAELFKTAGNYRQVFTRVLTDEKVTQKSLEEIKVFLGSASPNDEVIIFVAGHGVLDRDFNYYVAAYDMDFNDPAAKGISFVLLEAILDEVKSFRKVLFLDTCHSGEVDKDDAEADAQVVASTADLKFRSVGTQVKHKSLGMQQTTELMKEVFTDLRKGTGAHIISSAGGYELAVEGKEWKNGLFTYVLKEALSNRLADLNQDGIISIGELKTYVCRNVAEKSKGMQVPTARTENIRFDFRVW